MYFSILITKSHISYVSFIFSISIVAYMIYIGLLHMELVHCHPVLRVFCEELLQSNSSRKRDMNLGLHSANSIDTSSIVASYRSTRHISVRAYNKQILNRWMKFITLCNNPKLCETSSTNVKFHLPRDTIWSENKQISESYVQRTQPWNSYK